ncbi:MAG: single-stranded DNA-binding protein [Bacteroidetes bacterium]|nr:single-stranded DNA-binding protein [Bacteroidota bacterium]
MKTQNHTQLIGYLGNDPTSRIAVNGSRVARLRLATDYYRRDNAGNVIRKVTWHDILAWDQLAEKIPGNFIKGSHILVQGEIHHRTFSDEQGHKRYISEIKATTILNLDR